MPCTDERFIEIWAESGSPTEVAKKLGINVRNVYARRNRLEALGHSLPTVRDVPKLSAPVIRIDVKDGVVFAFGDAHYWPGEETTAHRALVYFLKNFQPAPVLLACVGDLFDGSGISRYPRIGWAENPTVAEELKAVDYFLNEIEEEAPDCDKVWCLGNHDARFETFLANRVPEYKDVDGFTLKYRYPKWKPCWALTINDDVVVKHRYHSGVWAARNNTMKSGVNIVTGHTHQLSVVPFGDYNGRRWGIEVGTLANVYGPQFSDYTEKNPVNWGSGFIVMTFNNGALLTPEVVEVFDNHNVMFRGQLIEV